MAVFLDWCWLSFRALSNQLHHFQPKPLSAKIQPFSAIQPYSGKFSQNGCIWLNCGWKRLNFGWKCQPFSAIFSQNSAIFSQHWDMFSHFQPKFSHFQPFMAQNGWKWLNLIFERPGEWPHVKMTPILPQIETMVWINGARTTTAMRWQTHQRLAGYASTVVSVCNFLSGWWVVRFMVSEGVGIFGRWPPSHRFSGFLSGECPSRWDDRPRPVILRHVGDAMAIIRSTRVQKLASWACSDQKQPQTQSAQAKACQWSCPWSLPCSGFGFNFRFRGNWNHGFDSENFNQNRNQNHGFNFPKMLLAAEFCGFN